VGVALSIALAAAGLWMANDIGFKMLLAGVAGVLLFLFVPVWIIGSYDAMRAGQHASTADLARPEFGATWGPTAYFAHMLWRRKHRRRQHGTLTPDNNELQRTRPAASRWSLAAELSVRQSLTP
jgi:hypothetical protein